ncbi:hypothetical protein JAAARDRAFT_697415 [Jaapia argillacea MUCL 33604]|uniref:Uncharacterized protein n=1 Tax=Jaapia argillacea MUCL 33604 TaxID=933084 RepID=A0A067PGX7_9AGAM|nr:hypothetical protein JAAARDRAFT_697415 [Jaapia argillacea MUCL 33604]
MELASSGPPQPADAPPNPNVRLVHYKLPGSNQIYVRPVSLLWMRESAWADGAVDPPQFYYSHEEIEAVRLAARVAFGEEDEEDDEPGRPLVGPQMPPPPQPIAPFAPQPVLHRQEVGRGVDAVPDAVTVNVPEREP